MKISEILTEASSPAQQAAIAIAMKKAGKKPKTDTAVKENGLQRYTGIKKYGKKGFEALQKAGREGASEEEKGRIKDRYLKNEGIDAELAEEFSLIERNINMLAERNAVDAEVIWEDLETLTDDELYVFAVTQEPVNEDWQKVNKRDRTSGMSQKAVNAYRREHPGSKLKTAVTTKPSKLKRGSKASKRRKSYCSRSRGQMKMHSINCSKTPDKAICAARRRWNC